MPSEPSPGDVAVDAESLPSIKSRFAPVLADAAQAIVDEAMSAASKPERRVAPTEVKNILECIDLGVIYPVQARTRKSFGLMTRKLSATESHNSNQFCGSLA